MMDEAREWTVRQQQMIDELRGGMSLQLSPEGKLRFGGNPQMGWPYVSITLTERAEQAEAEREVKEGESAGAYVERRIMDIFQEVAEHVGNEVFDLDHPAPIIRGSIVMTNAWNKYLASLRED